VKLRKRGQFSQMRQILTFLEEHAAQIMIVALATAVTVLIVATYLVLRSA